MPEVRIEFTEEVMQKMQETIDKHEIFESHEDFITHAVTDLLEEYTRGLLKR